MTSSALSAWTMCTRPMRTVGRYAIHDCVCAFPRMLVVFKDCEELVCRLIIRLDIHVEFNLGLWKRSLFDEWGRSGRLDRKRTVRALYPPQRHLHTSAGPCRTSISTSSLLIMVSKARLRGFFKTTWDIYHCHSLSKIPRGSTDMYFTRLQKRHIEAKGRAALSTGDSRHEDKLNYSQV
jgi:hypothetical protein